MTQYCQDGHVCDSLNVQRTQWPPTTAGERGHLGPFGHFYGPSNNILSDFKAPSHTDSQAIASLPLSTERRGHHSSQGPAFSLPRLDQFIHSFCQSARNPIVSTHQLGLFVISNCFSCGCDQMPDKKQLQKGAF